MALHCLRDAVDVKPDLMVSTAEKIVEKVSFFFIKKKLIISQYLQIMAGDHEDKGNRNVSRASQKAALALLRNMSIWQSLSILANHVSEPVPIGSDSIDLCRSLVDEKRVEMQNEPLITQVAQNAIHQLMPRLMRQVKLFYKKSFL